MAVSLFCSECKHSLRYVMNGACRFMNKGSMCLCTHVKKGIKQTFLTEHGIPVVKTWNT